MVRFILRRLARSFVTLLVYQALLFLLIQAMPGDFVSTLIGLPPSLRHGLRTILGFNDPLWKQFLRWMGQFFSGNLGTTLQFPHRPVLPILLELAPRTIFLFLPATLLTFWIGTLLGKYIAWPPVKRGWRAFGANAGIIIAVITYNSFPLWLAFVLVQFFALRWRWFPAENFISFHRWVLVPISPNQVIGLLLLTVVLLIVVYGFTRRQKSQGFRLLLMSGLITLTLLAWYASGLAFLALDLLWHLALPLATVVLFSVGEPLLMMRLFMRQMAGEDYIAVARAKGLPSQRIRDHHLARLAIIPVLGRFILQLPFVLLGSLVVEVAFYWKGMGSLLLTSIDYQDIPVIMGMLSVFGLLMLVAHTVLDVLQAWLDPRVRTGGLEKWVQF